MTEAQKEQRRQALAISGGVCEVCSAPLGFHAQGAHRIGNTIQNRKKYGDYVIDHPLNIAMVCSLACNAACDISKNTGACVRLCKRIYEHDERKYNSFDKTTAPC